MIHNNLIEVCKTGTEQSKDAKQFRALRKRISLSQHFFSNPSDVHQIKNGWMQLILHDRIKFTVKHC
jgi:hypothetical protein